METNNELFCKDCKHRFRQFSELPAWGSGYEWRCRKGFNEEKREIDPVSGYKTTPAHFERCSTMRILEAKGCGRAAKLWEPKKKKHFFLNIKYSER